MRRKQIVHVLSFIAAMAFSAASHVSVTVPQEKKKSGKSNELLTAEPAS